MLVPHGHVLAVRALLVGERIDARSVKPRLAENPVVTPVGDFGWAAVFRYGVIVLFGVADDDADRFLDGLASGVAERFAQPERERTEVHVDAGRREGVFDGEIRLREATVERLQLIAEILARSVMLAHYEGAVAEEFGRIEPMAEQLRKQGRASRRGIDLLKQIGGIISIQARMTGRVEIIDKPELLWERPELERLYLRLEDEFELRERHLALERKLSLIGDTAETLLEMLESRRTFRVEWYIVFLIIAEILLTL
ncbi:MAG TPA: RMD1 family protein, partial [Kofleriaceae bacterium]|nr:RMD1 family protein [Kofleriaceae bacterium]